MRLFYLQVLIIIIPSSKMGGVMDIISDLNQANIKMLNDIQEKTANLQNPNAQVTSQQFKLTSLKHPATKNYVEKTVEVYDKILSNISQLRKAKQIEKIDENGFLTLLAKNDRPQIFNILNKNLKLSTNLAAGMSKQICLGNQAIENMKAIIQSLKISNLPLKSVVSQIKSMVRLRQSCIKQQRVHYLFTQLNTSKFDQASNFVKQQLSETFRQPALKYIDDSRSINGHIENIYKLLNNKYVKYRSDVQLVAYKDPNKALNEICKQVDRRSTTVYCFVQEIQKLAFVFNKSKLVKGNLKFADKLQNILNLLRGAYESQEKLRRIKTSYQALIYTLNQHKNLLNMIKERNARKIVIDVQKNLEETLKQYQKEFRTHFEAALASEEKNIELRNLRDQMNKALADTKFSGNKTNANTETNALRAIIAALQQMAQEKTKQISKYEAQLREQASVIAQLQDRKLKLDERIFQCQSYNNRQKQLSRAKMQQLTSKMNALQDMISSKNSELAKYKKQLQAASNKHKTQTDEFKFKMAVVDKKNAHTVSSLKQLIAQLQNLTVQLQNQIKQLKQKNSLLAETSCAHLQQLKIKHQQEQNRQNSSTSQRQSSYQLEIIELKQTIKTKQSELKTKQIHLQTWKKQLEAQLASIKSDLQHKSKQLLEEQRRNFNQLKSSSQKQAQNSKSLLQKANTKIQQLQSELKEKKTKINDLSKKQEELTKNIIGLKVQLKTKQQQSSQLSTKIVSLTKEIEQSHRLRMQLQQQERQISKLQADLQSSIQAHTKSVQNLRKQDQVKEKKLKSEKKAAKKQLNQQIKAISKIQQHFQMLQTELKQKQAELDLIKEQSKLNKQILTQKEEEIMRIQRQYYRLKQAVEAKQMTEVQRQDGLEEEQNKSSQIYFTELQRHQPEQQETHQLTLHFQQQLKKERQIVRQLKQKNIQLEKQVRELNQEYKSRLNKLPQQLISYYESAAQKHPQKEINFLDIFLIDRFLQGDLLEQQVLYKQTILNAIQKLQRKKISATKFLYKNDPRNKTTFHEYIDGTRHMLVIVKVSKEIMLAGYYSGEYSKQAPTNEPGLLISLNSGIVFELHSQIAKTKHYRVMTYERCYLMFGSSSQLRLQLDGSGTKIYSRFMQGSLCSLYFNERGHKRNTLLASESGYESSFQMLEIYEVQF